MKKNLTVSGLSIVFESGPRGEVFPESALIFLQSLQTFDRGDGSKRQTFTWSCSHPYPSSGLPYSPFIRSIDVKIWQTLLKISQKVGHFSGPGAPLIVKPVQFSTTVRSHKHFSILQLYNEQNLIHCISEMEYSVVNEKHIYVINHHQC